MNRGRTGAAGAAIGAVLGLLLSALLTAPRGMDHKCAAGASVQACTYPPNLGLWRAEWTVAGALIGMLFGLAVIGLARAWGRDRFPHRV